MSVWHLTGDSPIIDRLLFRNCESVSLSKKVVEVCGWSSVDGEAVSDSDDSVNFFWHIVQIFLPGIDLHHFVLLEKSYDTTLNCFIIFL